MNIFALPCGGFEVRDAWFGDDQDTRALISERGRFERPPAIAAFSTLDEALDWLYANMARPAEEAAK